MWVIRGIRSLSSAWLLQTFRPWKHFLLAQHQNLKNLQFIDLDRLLDLSWAGNGLTRQGVLRIRLVESYLAGARISRLAAAHCIIGAT